MSDNLDIASEREEMARTFAQAVRKPAGPVATGRCLYCDDVVGDRDRWCSVDCAKDWEKLQARRS